MYSYINNKSVTIEKSYSILTLIVVLISFFMGPSVIMGKVLSVLTVGLVLYPLLKALKTENNHLVVLFVFMISYVFIPLNYYWLGIHINFYQECENEYTVYTALQILSVFHSILLYKLKFSNTKNKKNIRRFTTESNNTVYVILMVLSFLCVTFGSTGLSIFVTGGYLDSINSRQSSVFFAYSVITISLAYIYSNTTNKRNITYCLVAYFCIKDLSMGNRVDSLELLFAIFLIRLQYIWSRKTIILVILVGGLFFMSWGVLRSDVNIGFANAIMQNLHLFSNQSVNIDYQTGNAADVYYSSVRIIYMIERGIISFGMRLESLFYFFVSSIVPYSMLPDYANLSSFMQSTYWSGGGGLGPVFFYAFGGWIGVLVFSFFVSYSIDLFNNIRSSKYIHYYTILVLASTPRWYAYYPIQLIKFCLLGMILYIILTKFFATKPSRKVKQI